MEISLDGMRRTIALEARSGDSALRVALNKLPAFFAQARSSLTNGLVDNVVALFKPHDLEWAGKKLAAIPYGHIRMEGFPCVPGLKVPYPTYADTLVDCLSFAKGVQADYLDPYLNYLAVKLANSSALRNHAHEGHMDLFTGTHAAKATQILLSSFATNSDKAVQPYGKLFRRQGDWATFIAQAKHVNALFGSLDNVKLRGSVERVSELMGTLSQRIKEHPDVYAMSSEVIETITRGAVVCAQVVEAYGLIVSRAAAFQLALEALVAKVKAMP